jgi:signal transduction histidine kinase
VLATLAEALAGQAEVFLLPAPPPDGTGSRRLAIGARLPDGTGIASDIRVPPPPERPRALAFLLVITMATLVAVIGLLTIWATRSLVSPLARLSEAVGGFDPDRDGEVVADRGPIEVRRLGRAFNAMSARIRRLVEQRTRMLAAVSHDLRTPITRMRLRTEDIDDTRLRHQMQSDLALMERMVGGALAFLRDGRASGAMVRIDLPPLLQTLCDDFADLGHAAHYAGPDHGAAWCDPDQMGRALTNLVDNALKFGGRADVRLSFRDGVATVEVEDDGPGLAPEERQKVLEPFYRADLARSLRERDGFGLGLAIARATAIAHRGELTLHEGASGGLLARLSWPAERAA